MLKPVLARLHWLPIRFWAQFKVLVLTYKALHGLGPQYLTEYLSRHEPTHTLRSTSKVLLRVPTPREAQRKATREGTFSVVAPRLWNDLPEEARLVPTLLSFWRQVKTYLFPQAINNVLSLFSFSGPQNRIVVLICIFMFLSFSGFNFVY